MCTTLILLLLTNLYSMENNFELLLDDDLLLKQPLSPRHEECAKKFSEIVSLIEAPIKEETNYPALSSQQNIKTTFSITSSFLIMFRNKLNEKQKECQETKSIVEFERWLNESIKIVSPKQILDIIDKYSYTNLDIKKHLTNLATSHYINLLKSPYFVLTTTDDFPYQLLGMRNDDVIKFNVKSAPLEETPDAYKNFALSFYKLLINGHYDLTPLRTLPIPKTELMQSIISTSPLIMLAFTEFYTALNGFSSNSVVQRRFELIRAVAHALYDFNYEYSFINSVYCKIAGTLPLVGEAQVTLDGQLLSLEGKEVNELTLKDSAYPEICLATKIFLNKILSLWYRDFIVNVRNSQRILVFPKF